MGCGHSKHLAQEVTKLEEQLRKTQQQVETVSSEKRMIEFKLNVLQEMAANAQVEVEQYKHQAFECEERMKAMKWELVRQLSASSSKPAATASEHFSVQWRLKDDATRRATLPEKPPQENNPKSNVSSLAHTNDNQTSDPAAKDTSTSVSFTSTSSLTKAKAKAKAMTEGKNSQSAQPKPSFLQKALATLHVEDAVGSNAIGEDGDAKERQPELPLKKRAPGSHPKHRVPSEPQQDQAKEDSKESKTTTKATAPVVHAPQELECAVEPIQILDDDT